MMMVKDIALADVDVSEFNTRKDILDGQQDSTIADLAKSIQKHGLLSPITVYQRPDGRYALIAGPRRFLACKQLGMDAISAVVRDPLEEADATAISLVENVHRADMNPRDKATAFKTLVDTFGDYESVHRETGVGTATIRKYLQLLELAPELQERLAAGEAKNTDALARLAKRFGDPSTQVEVWNLIEAFTQDVQREVINKLDPDLSNLNEVLTQAHEGAFDVTMVRNCPFDCPTIPEPLKTEVARLLEEFETKRVESVKKATPRH